MLEKETAKIGKFCFMIETCNKIGKFTHLSSHKLTENFILYFSNLYFSYLCPHQSKKNKPTQKTTDVNNILI